VEIWAVIAGAITLVIGIFNEWFGAKAREREQLAAFDKRELEFGVIAQRALEKWHRDAAQASHDSQSGQDWLDRNTKGKP